MGDELNQNETSFAIGEDLYSVSIESLCSRLEVLRLERERIKVEITKKEKDLSAAHKLFGD